MHSQVIIIKRLVELKLPLKCLGFLLGLLHSCPLSPAWPKDIPAAPNEFPINIVCALGTQRERPGFNGINGALVIDGRVDRFLGIPEFQQIPAGFSIVLSNSSYFSRVYASLSFQRTEYLSSQVINGPFNPFYPPFNRFLPLFFFSFFGKIGSPL